MKEMRKKVAYLEGLMEGMDVGDNTKEGRVLAEVVSVLHDMADSIMELDDIQADLEAQVEAIDEDLNELENEVYEQVEASKEFVETECPDCHQTVCFKSDILEDDDVIEVTCPNCDAVVFINDQDYELVEEPDTVVSVQDDDL